MAPYCVLLSWVRGALDVAGSPEVWGKLDPNVEVQHDVQRWTGQANLVAYRAGLRYSYLALRDSPFLLLSPLVFHLDAALCVQNRAFVEKGIPYMVFSYLTPVRFRRYSDCNLCPDSFQPWLGFARVRSGSI